MKRAHPAWRMAAFALTLVGVSVGLRLAGKIDAHGMMPKYVVRALGAGVGAVAALFVYRVLWVLGSLAREAGRIKRDARGARALARAGKREA